MIRGLAEFWKAIRADRGAVVLLWVLGLGVTLLQLVPPQQVGRLTNLLTVHGAGAGWGQIHATLALLVVSQGAVAAFNYARGRRMDRLRQHLVSAAVMRMYRRLVRVDPEFLRGLEADKLSLRVLEDTRTTTVFWFDLLLRMPLILASLLVYGAFMVATNWFFAACLIPLCFLSCYFLAFDRRIQRVTRDNRNAWDDVRAKGREYVGSLEETRPNNCSGHQLKLLDRSLGGFHRATEDMSRLRSLMNAASPIVATIQDSALYWIGAALCLLTLKSVTPFGPVTWGDVIKFMLAAALFKRPVTELAAAVEEWRMNGIVIESVRAQEALPLTFGDPSSPFVPLAAGGGLGYDRVDVVTPSGARILNHVTLEIREGEHVALVGPAGCGKSTVLRLMFRDNRASDGEVRLRGFQIDEVSLGALAREVGVVQQNPCLLDTTLRNNLLLALRRPSSRTIRDDEGDLDVETLPGVRTVADLDRELIRILEVVGLDGDVLCKALDAPVPARHRDGVLLRRIPELRQRIAEALARSAATIVLRFDAAAFLRQGTLRDNLLFGLRLRAPSGAEEAVSDAQLARCLREEGLLEPMLQAGLRRLQQDGHLAAGLPRRTPELDDLLRLLRQAGSTDPRPLPPVFDLQAIRGDVRAALLDAALQTDARRAVEAIGLPDVEARVVAARARLRDALVRDGRRCEDFLSPGRTYGLTLRELLLLGRVDVSVFRSQEQVDRAIRDVLSEQGVLADALLMGLECPVGGNGRFLSGGQKQKVAIGRAILKRPSILLLDEATSALDELSQRRIIDLVGTAFEGRTVVTISHRLAMIEGCHRIFVFDRGALVQEGTYGELAAQAGVFRTLLDQQGATRTIPAAGPPKAGAIVAGLEPDDLKHQLARCGLFSSLTAHQLELLARVAKGVRCDADTVLFRRGDPGGELFVVLHGQVEFFVEETAPTGERAASVRGEANAGEAFGEIAVFSGWTRTLSARTRTETRLALIGSDTLKHLLDSSPPMAVALLQTLARRITRMREELYGPPGSASGQGQGCA